ncbi:MAG: hypothetical protein EHM78_27095 [Myxococcaceae bacterium]|nr:MAG: hypothetical protein EHM78_27095 [Myxococcaceae bacterium]
MATQVGALPASVDLVTYAGDDFWVNLKVVSSTGTPVDLSPFTPKAQIRAAPRSTAVLGEFVITAPDATTLKLYLPGDVSRTLPDLCAWDVQLSDDLAEVVMTLAAGGLHVTPEVTR